MAESSNPVPRIIQKESDSFPGKINNVSGIDLE
jgi:hypothetical protein